MVQDTHHYIEMRLNEYLNICCVPDFEFAVLGVVGYVSLFHPMVSGIDSASGHEGVEPKVWCFLKEHWGQALNAIVLVQKLLSTSFPIPSFPPSYIPSSVFFFSFLETKCHCVSQASLQLTIPLPYLPKGEVTDIASS